MKESVRRHMHNARANGKNAKYVYRAWRRHPKTGEKLWARDYGLRAWRIPVR